ncbi:hypothetical protein VPH35_031143 [Triticum aestivum]
MHGETATTKIKTNIPYLPDALPLLRFRSVCKAWRGIIDEDSFLREHLRFQTSSLLVAASRASDTLLHAVSDYRSKKKALHSMAHCDGLCSCLAFGLGHDSRSNAYKVARFYGYRNLDVCVPGKDLCWRDMVEALPPHHVMPRRMATFFKGSLLWTLKEGVMDSAPVASGFVRFRLEDESFSIVSAPPYTPRLNYKTCNLTKLRGELCVCARPSADYHAVFEMWMCRDLEDDIMTDDAVVFHFEENYIYNCDLQNPIFNLDDVIEMERLRYHHLDTDTFVEYTQKILAGLYLIPYVPSLVWI